MYALFKPFLFRLQPEAAHHVVFRLLRLPGVRQTLSALKPKDDPRLGITVGGLRFRNPIGLAAGLDKDALAFEQFGHLGFGFVEIGTVTPRAQPGNGKPRLFRLVNDEALINRMGFNNQGAEAAAVRLARRRDPTLVIGGNIGRNKTTSNEQAAEDYLTCLRTLHPHVDYFAVNVSSPNTPNLRELQDKEPLTKLILALQAENSRLGHRPMFLKIAPDLTLGQLDDVLDIAARGSLTGIIATNTTISREGLSYDKNAVESIGAGGLSGRPLTRKSTDIIRYLRANGGDKLVIIGSGGIHTANDAIEKLDAGADLIQLYTGFIYHGPALIDEIRRALLKRKK
jgi:dihydroorotate dehydrogenase